MADQTPGGYARTLAEAKAAIHEARIRAVMAVNAELIDLDLQLGEVISDVDLLDGLAEHQVESAMIRHVEGFLLALRGGFALIGRHNLLDIDGADVFVDLLFFHIPTKRFMVIEVDRGAHPDEALGKLDSCLNAVDNQLRREGHDPAIGLLLRIGSNRVVVRPADTTARQLDDVIVDAVEAAVEVFGRERGGS